MVHTWIGVWVLAAAAPPISPMLERGIAQVRDSQMTEAVVTLDAAIMELAPQVETRRAELVSAWVHKGWALVQLQQLESARVCFRAALQQDPDLRLSADVYPGPVLDVFDSVRPSGAPSDRGSGWDPVKIGITAGLVGLGAVTAIKAAQPKPEISPFHDYYGSFGVRFAFRDPQACSGFRLPLFANFVLSGNLDGSDFAVGLQPSLLAEIGAPPVSRAPGTIERNGAFTASAPDANLTFTGGVDRVTVGANSVGANSVGTISRRLAGVMTYRGCAYTFQ